MADIINLYVNLEADTVIWPISQTHKTDILHDLLKVTKLVDQDSNIVMETISVSDCSLSVLSPQYYLQSTQY